jgi:hypothetical protein
MTNRSDGDDEWRCYGYFVNATSNVALVQSSSRHVDHPCDVISHYAPWECKCFHGELVCLPLLDRKTNLDACGLVEVVFGCIYHLA